MESATVRYYFNGSGLFGATPGRKNYTVGPDWRPDCPIQKNGRGLGMANENVLGGGWWLVVGWWGLVGDANVNIWARQ